MILKKNYLIYLLIFLNFFGPFFIFTNDYNFNIYHVSFIIGIIYLFFFQINKNIIKNLFYVLIFLFAIFICQFFFLKILFFEKFILGYLFIIISTIFYFFYIYLLNELKKNENIKHIFNFDHLIYLFLIFFLINFMIDKFSVTQNSIYNYKQVDSVFHGNVNNQAFHLCIIFFFSLFYCKKKLTIFFFFIITLIYIINVDAKIVFIFFVIQIIFLFIENLKNKKLKIFFYVLCALSLLYLLNLLFFSEYIDIIENNIINENFDSITLRYYYLNIMLDKIQNFNIINFFIGYGVFNTDFSIYLNDKFMQHKTEFLNVAHFFIIEIFISFGFSIFLMIYLMFKNLIVSKINFIKFSPLIMMHITLSSAIYFLPFYFLLAFISVNKNNNIFQN